MNIVYHGYSCFEIKGKNVTVITDPYSPELGIILPELSADIVTVSHQHKNHCHTKIISGNPKIFDWPGEYEKSEVGLVAIESFHNTKEEPDLGENLIFIYIIENVRICHLGSQGCKLTAEQLEKIGDVDILLLPIGGKTTLTPQKALEVLEQIEPRVVIPMHYALPNINKELASVEQFAEIMGKPQIETKIKFDIHKSGLPDDQTELVILESMNS